MNADAKIETAPLPAATVLVLRDDPFEVLMVRRRSQSYFSSALVFPGGVVDPGDARDEWVALSRGAQGLALEERALRVAACRETFEETSILLGGPADLSAQRRDGEAFLAAVRASASMLPLDQMARIGHWITPRQAPKRFDTHFFVCAAPAGATPVSDDDETVSVEWVRPQDAIARAAAGEHTILFPTLMNLRRLNESQSAAEAIDAARAGAVFTVEPRIERRDAGVFVVIPEEAGYGVTEHPAPRSGAAGGR